MFFSISTAVMLSKSKTTLKTAKAGTPSPRKLPRKVARRAQSRAAHLEQDLEVSENLLWMMGCFLIPPGFGLS